MAVELNMDIDTMRDVYMTPSQRQAYDRILARALEQREAATPPRDVPEEEMRKLAQQAQELRMGYPNQDTVLVSRDSLESAMQLLYMASNGRANIFANTADEFRDLLAAAPSGEGENG